MNQKLRAELTCEDLEHVLDLYLDGEVDDVERREIEMHLHHCPDCASLEARHRHTRQRLRALASDMRAPADFRARLEQSLNDARASARTAEIEVARPGSRLLAGVSRPWAIAAASLAAVLLVAVPVGLVVARATQAPTATADNEVLGMTSVRSPVIDEAIAWHERSVPVEVTGPDPEHVHDWFEDEGMVDFDMVIPDLGRRSTLLGGRLSHVRYHEAGYLLYEVGGKKLTVLIFHQPEEADAAAKDPSAFKDDELLVDNRSGHNVVLTKHGDLTYTFTSDMDSERLLSLVESAF